MMIKKIPNLYEVQQKFIVDCKSTIDNSQIGIFSSPTGTGKTLSLLLSVIDYITEIEEDDLLIEHIMGPSTKTKIYFCSRTHSQLKQCVTEFKNLELKTNSVILGSRKIYCINRDIDNKENIEKVNSKCRDLINNEKCVYHDKDMLISGVFDIEELVREGRKHKSCPYYFTKKFYKKCELVFLPYNLIFNDESRTSLNINLSNSIVIVDEAHNIIDAVNNINTKVIYFEHLERYLMAFEKYMKILRNKSKNRENIEKLSEIFKKLLKYKNFEHIIHEVNSFLFESDLLHYNMLEIEEFLKINNFSLKIYSYGKLLNNKIADILKFLNLLVNSDTNCKIEVSPKYLKIFPIDAKLYFEPFIDCQSVIFAGGTMEPINQLKNIFSSRIVNYFSYDSVANDFKAFIVSKINGQKFELTEKTRDTKVIHEGIKNLVKNLILNTKRGGIVIFLPSKYYLEIVRNLFGNDSKMFYENYHTFEDYKLEVENNVSVLFAVMGGKLSEGMNFNDDLCRILVIFGIPFPNLTNELDEKIKYFGPDFYLQIAMQKVNQTIGRAIRHKNDYASLMLIDSRYLKYQNELSPWFRKKVVCLDLQAAVNETKDFIDKRL